MENQVQEKLAIITNDIEHLQGEVAALEKTVIRGNGAPALTTQIANLTSKIDNVEENMQLKLEHLTSLINTHITTVDGALERKFQESLVSKGAQWEIIAALITSFTAVVIAAGSIFFK